MAIHLTHSLDELCFSTTHFTRVSPFVLLFFFFNWISIKSTRWNAEMRTSSNHDHSIRSRRVKNMKQNIFKSNNIYFEWEPAAAEHIKQNDLVISVGLWVQIDKMPPQIGRLQKAHCVALCPRSAHSHATTCGLIILHGSNRYIMRFFFSSFFLYYFSVCRSSFSAILRKKRAVSRKTGQRERERKTSI